jgi:hypothetical protein
MADYYSPDGIPTYWEENEETLSDTYQREEDRAMEED